MVIFEGDKEGVNREVVKTNQPKKQRSLAPALQMPSSEGGLMSELE